MFYRGGKPVNLEHLPVVGRISRLVAPGAELAEGEQTVFDASVGRGAVNVPWYWRFPFSRHESFGRLILTNRRLVYRTGRDPYTFLIFKYPRHIANVNLELSRIVGIDYRSRWYRALWHVSAMPGLAVVEILSDNGELYRFHSVPRALWDEAIGELTTVYPSLQSALEFPSGEQSAS